MPVEIVCFNCGKTVARPPSEARSETTFCTRRCRAQFQARERMNQTAEQFWSRVATGKPDECWEWTGYRNPTGYGQMAWMGRLRLTHRIAMSLTDGDWNNKLLVCHGCDNPPCCNPAHLWRGTHRQNQHDKIAKGRAKYTPMRGEMSHRAKLTAAQVFEIRESKEAPAILAAKYGIAKSYVSALRSRGASTWSDIPITPRQPPTHCHKGHKYSGKRNTAGALICAICHSEKNFAYRQRRKERTIQP
jgi:hypothetical protein